VLALAILYPLPIANAKYADQLNLLANNGANGVKNLDLVNAITWYNANQGWVGRNTNDTGGNQAHTHTTTFTNPSYYHSANHSFTNPTYTLTNPTYTLTNPTYTLTAPTYTLTLPDAALSNPTVSQNLTASGTGPATVADNTLQPYTTCHMWKRTG